MQYYSPPLFIGPVIYHTMQRVRYFTIQIILSCLSPYPASCLCRSNSASSSFKYMSWYLLMFSCVTLSPCLGTSMATIGTKKREVGCGVGPYDGVQGNTPKNCILTTILLILTSSNNNMDLLGVRYTKGDAPPPPKNKRHDSHSPRYPLD